MVSAAEQLAANLNFSALAMAEELKKRIWFTLGALLVYRFGTYIPLPALDPSAWDPICPPPASARPPPGPRPPPPAPRDRRRPSAPPAVRPRAPRAASI